MVIKRDIWFSPTQKCRGLHIYLPEDYDCTQERYPVMYFFDGHNLFYDGDATYGTCWGLKDFMDHWDKKVIIVGIECGHEGNERLNEYCPYKIDRGFLGHAKGVGDETVRWMVEDLKEMIDKEYRTYPFRECTAVAGSSMGGLMALFAVIRYNQWFSKAACVSSALGFCMPNVYGDLKTCPISPDTRAYFSWGTREARGVADHSREDKSSYLSRRNRSVANYLKSEGASTQIYCQIGGQHCEADWGRQIPGFMKFLWQS